MDTTDPGRLGSGADRQMTVLDCDRLFGFCGGDCGGSSCHDFESVLGV
jgi:hypothetical protein